ncbi:MAG: DUF2911 domain-containing protein [bacterium]
MVTSKRTYRIFVFLILLIAISSAQEKDSYILAPPKTPRDSAVATFNGKRIAIYYGRPSMQGRKIFGDLVPYYREWRTGAGEATTLVTTGDLIIGGMVIPESTYTLYTFPSTTQWKLIVNKQTGQWGTRINPKYDLGRIDLTKKILMKPVETLTIKIEKQRTYTGVLKIEWEYTSLSIPFEVSTVHRAASPRGSTTLAIGSGLLSVQYSRPYLRGRKIFGQVVPYDSVWRIGADTVTTLRTTADFEIGALKIPKGAYSLWMLPTRSSARLLINSKTGVIGKDKSDYFTLYKKYEFGQATIQRRATKATVDTLTISLNKLSDSTAVMKIDWERTSFSVPLKIINNPPPNQQQRRK